MQRFWKQRSEFDQLEGELRRRRPRPRPEYVETVAAQLQQDKITAPHRPALRYRVAVAAAVTGLLGVAAAASGGLNYANTASTHTVKTVAHVFSSASTSESRAQASHDATASASNSRTSGSEARNDHQSGGQGSDRGDSSRGDDSRSHEHENASHHQYVEFVFVCLRVPPRHPFIFVTLRLPKVAADNLVARGLATPGPC